MVARKCTLIALLMLVFQLSFGQQTKGTQYKTAIGGKFYPGAVTLKHFLDSR